MKFRKSLFSFLLKSLPPRQGCFVLVVMFNRCGCSWFRFSRGCSSGCAGGGRDGCG